MDDHIETIRRVADELIEHITKGTQTVVGEGGAEAEKLVDAAARMLHPAVVRLEEAIGAIERYITTKEGS